MSVADKERTVGEDQSDFIRDYPYMYALTAGR